MIGSSQSFSKYCYCSPVVEWRDLFGR